MTNAKIETLRLKSVEGANYEGRWEVAVRGREVAFPDRVLQSQQCWWKRQGLLLDFSLLVLRCLPQLHSGPSASLFFLKNGR